MLSDADGCEGSFINSKAFPTRLFPLSWLEAIRSCFLETIPFEEEDLSFNFLKNRVYWGIVYI